MKNKACKPFGYSAIKDTSASYPSTGGLQHVYYKGFYRQSCGWAYQVAHTDHPGYTLELRNRKKAVSCPNRSL